jgi:hypothetical protein
MGASGEKTATPTLLANPEPAADQGKSKRANAIRKDAASSLRGLRFP